MEVYRMSSWLLLLFGVLLYTTSLHGARAETDAIDGPSESECRPFIEKALKELEVTDGDADGDENEVGNVDDDLNLNLNPDLDADPEPTTTDDNDDPQTVEITTDNSPEDLTTSVENASDQVPKCDNNSNESTDHFSQSNEEITDENNEIQTEQSEENDEQTEIEEEQANEEQEEKEENEEEEKKSQENLEEIEKSEENTKEESVEQTIEEEKEEKEEDEIVEKETESEQVPQEDEEKEEKEAEAEEEEEIIEKDAVPEEVSEEAAAPEETSQEASPAEDVVDGVEASAEKSEEVIEKESEEKTDDEEDKINDSTPVEELSEDFEIPADLRARSHVEQLLKLDDDSSETEDIINRIAEITLKELKKLYENAIKPLEVLYKYRDLSNRHFGDSEIFSKPLVLFMGPWSGGKSSIINYLLNNEYNETSLRTGAEPSPAYFNIMLHGDEPEIIDGTELTADFTFSGLQKFGQGLEERLRGVRLPSPLLEKVDIVEIPGILEVRKQVSRVFPFNDACQWFIDRADIIFLVYDPSKLDVGPETEAILDQLKGREHQTRIVLNKADQVKPEELMRVQGALIWNISPLMSSAQPPIMYTLSLWSRPYESWAPVKLLQAQERAFLRDLRTAVDRRIENKIASARRFAVRVRNHAKMVDCYLTTYYNHKSLFGNRKQVADEITEHPQDYHIYEGLSTLTNISRYDLPDPDVYRDFFKLNPLYDFQQLSATCTYFRGCPINRLDVAIAYDLPELIGKHKRLVEAALNEDEQKTTS